MLPESTITAASISHEWVGMIREMLHDGGRAFRAGAHNTIEVQRISDGKFLPLSLEKTNSPYFATAEDRDAIYRQLSQRPNP